MNFYEIFFKWWFWAVVVFCFCYFTLIEWRYYLYSGMVNFIIDFLISLVVSFFIAVIIFGLIYLFLFFFYEIRNIGKFINIRNYQ